MNLVSTEWLEKNLYVKTKLKKEDRELERSLKIYVV